MSKSNSWYRLTNAGYTVFGSVFGSTKIIARFPHSQHDAAISCAKKVDEICKTYKMKSVERFNALFDLAEENGISLGKRIQPEPFVKE